MRHSTRLTTEDFRNGSLSTEASRTKIHRCPLCPKATIRRQSTIRRYLGAARVLDPSQQRPGGVVSEQLSIADIAGQHGVRGVARL
jgi:hypothetical protein